jgi:glycosyltransferase involved in cell wall biosynthesis
MKSPLHPSPSGDRTVARLLMRALAQAGFEPRLACEVRTLEPKGDPAEQDCLKGEAERCAARLIESYRSDPRPPRLWFTYHVYYKAPDWIGPAVSEALRIPYAIAEGSRAGKRASGPWALGHRGAEAALDKAKVVFAMTAHDRMALDRAKTAGQAVLDLPPFLDVGDWTVAPPARRLEGPPRLLAVGMMREGDKLASYRLLAEALHRIADKPWSLDVIGSGEARAKVERAFAAFHGRVRFHGALNDRSALASFYAAADLLVWPAVNEAYGMVFLEAGAFGCPAVAGAFGGVPSVVRDRETGLLTSPGDGVSFAEAVARLLDDAGLRLRLGAAARVFVTEERSLDAASARLRDALMPLVTVAA